MAYRPRYKYIPLKLALAIEPYAAGRGVSKVARSKRGFMRAYEEAKEWKNLSEYWLRRRDGFIARHMAQVEGNDESLWEDDGSPTRRHLALIMWAYTPDAARVRRWMKRAATVDGGRPESGRPLIRVEYTTGETGWAELIEPEVARIDNHPLTPKLRYGDLVRLGPPSCTDCRLPTVYEVISTNRDVPGTTGGPRTTYRPSPMALHLAAEGAAASCRHKDHGVVGYVRGDHVVVRLTRPVGVPLWRTVDGVPVEYTIGGLQKCYSFATRCVEAEGPDISEMVDNADDVSFDEVRDNVKEPTLDDWAQDMGYELDPEDGLTLEDDWAVSFHRGVFRGRPAYYVVHSGIEHIWTWDDECGDPPARKVDPFDLTYLENRAWGLFKGQPVRAEPRWMSPAEIQALGVDFWDTDPSQEYEHRAARYDLEGPDSIVLYDGPDGWVSPDDIDVLQWAVEREVDRVPVIVVNPE